MLNTEKLLNQYGLTLEEAEQLLQTDIISQLMSVRDTGGAAITQQLPLIDASVVGYLNGDEVKAILEANAKDPIEDVDVGGFEDLEIDTTFDIDSGDLDDFDLRVTDIDVGDLGDLGELGDEAQEEQPPVVVAPVKEAKKEPTTIEAYKISGVDVADFLLTLGADDVPQVNSEGALVLKANGITMKATYVDDFVMLSTMPLNSEKVDVTFMSDNPDVDFEGYKFAGKEGEFIRIDPSELKMSLEEVSAVFDSQQYAVDNTEANISFDGVTTMIESIEKFNAEFTSKMVLPLGVAIDSNMTRASQFFIDPVTMYDLANCDTFFKAAVASRMYITNYCEANDLEHLRIFELGGEHLNVPLARFVGSTISDQTIVDNAFSERVGKLVTPSTQTNQRLMEVGFAPAVPKDVAYNRIDSLSDVAGFMVYVSKDSSEVVYIPSVVVNYFEKYYGDLDLFIGSNKQGKYRVVMFNTPSTNTMQGFYMLDADKVKTAKPARLLPTNPEATKEKVMAEHADAFTNKIDLAAEMGMDIIYLGDVREQPEVSIEVSPLDEQIATTASEQEVSGGAIADLQKQIGLNEEALSIMTIGEDDDLIAVLQGEIDFLKDMISEFGGGTSDEEVLEAQVENLAEETDLELGEMKVGNDQEILPTPSADDPVVEEITDMEAEAIEGDDYDFEVELADEPSMEADDDVEVEEMDEVEAELEIDEDDDIEVNPAPTFEDEDEDFDIEGDIDLGDIDLDFAKGGAVPPRKTSMRKVMEGVRKSDGGPYTAMAWMGTRLDEQRLIRYPQEVPLAVEKLRNDFPNSRIEVEDVTGRIFYVGTPTREVSFAKGGRPNPTKHIRVDYVYRNQFGYELEDDVIESTKDVEEVREKWKYEMMNDPDLITYQIIEVKADGSERKVPSKFHGFAKGGSVAPPVRDVQKTIEAMTDVEVADKLTKLMYQSLESAEYEMSEGDAYQYALDNIDDARRYLIEIVTEMELQDELS